MSQTNLYDYIYDFTISVTLCVMHDARLLNRTTLNFRDMNFEQLGSDLLQQPLLSAQIIPNLSDADLIVNSKSKKPTVAIQSQQSYKTTEPIVLHATASSAAAVTKTTTTTTTVNQNATAQKMQIVKKAPANVMQRVVEPKPTSKPNAVINDNSVITNNPIVINKINGNISGK